jgi:hypothetical protein
VTPLALFVTVAGTIGALIVASSPEPHLDPPAAPKSTIWQAYEYGEIPVEASKAPETSVEAHSNVEKQSAGRCLDWSLYAAEIGFKDYEIDILERILWLESRCQPGRVRDKQYGGSYGVAQIHAPTWCKPSKYWPEGYLQTQGVIMTCDDLFDVRHNIRAAYAIFVYAGRSFHPWSTYKMIGGTK